MFAILLTNCSSKKNDLEESNLKGKIWKIKETKFEGEERFGKYQIGEKRYFGHQFYVFNEEGYLIDYQQLDRKGKTERTSKYSYDKKGNRTEITTYEDDKVIQKQINQIDNNRIKESQVFDDEGKVTAWYQYVYSGTDIISGKVLNSDGSLSATFQNKMSEGFLTKQILKDSLEQITTIVNLERNKEGDVITEKNEFPTDTTEYTYSYQYEYDEKGNWLKQYQFDRDGKIDDIIVRHIIYYNESKVAKKDKDFYGIWFVLDDNDWIEFRQDKKYDSGCKDRIKETGNWEIDTKQQLLTFRADDPDDSRKYKYGFEGYQLILFTINGEEKLRLEKR